MSADNTYSLAEKVLELSNLRGLRIAVAESLTGGLVSAALSAVPGASSVLLGGVVAYQDLVKQAALGVPTALLGEVGAVDAGVALKMAEGVRKRFAEDCGINDELVVGLATTGVAGPETIEGKPVGTVFIGLKASGHQVVRELALTGTREQIREQTVDAVLQMFLEQFQG